jgi:hypothetical protein
MKSIMRLAVHEPAGHRNFVEDQVHHRNIYLGMPASAEQCPSSWQVSRDDTVARFCCCILIAPSKWRAFSLAAIGSSEMDCKRGINVRGLWGIDRDRSLCRHVERLFMLALVLGYFAVLDAAGREAVFSMPLLQPQDQALSQRIF